MAHIANPLLCPSAQPDMEGSQIIGLISGSPERPEIAYLPPDVAVDQSVADNLAGVTPTEVFRYAAKCEEHRCGHFDGARCTLAQRIVAQLPVVVEILPRCKIRVSCRWYAEEGAEACRRCPQVITRIPRRDDALNRVAQPVES